MANQVTLILLDDVAKLGLAGDEVVVKAGYARNYLIPRGLAAKATPGILRLVESRKAMIAERRAKELAAQKGMTVAQVAQCFFYGQAFQVVPVMSFSSNAQMEEAERNTTEAPVSLPELFQEYQFPGNQESRTK